MRRLVLAAAGLLICILAALTTGTSPAGAHAFLVSSSPADGTSLGSAPHLLRLDFSESVVPEATRIDVVAADGRRFAPQNQRVVRAEDTEEPSHVLAELPSLPSGAYRVEWRTLSSDDLHNTSGVFAFGIGARVDRSAFVEPLPQPEESLLRVALFLGLFLAIGGLVAGALYRRVAYDDVAAARRCRQAGAAGAVLGLVAAIALLVDQVSAGGSGFAQVVSGAYGLRWLLRLAGLAALLVAAVRGRGRLGAVSGWAGAGLACLGSALLGHQQAGGGGPTGVLADAVHVAAVACWVGTLLVLVLAFRPGAAGPWRRVLRAFGAPAVVCVAAVVVTGVYLTSSVVGSVDALLLTWYGRILLFKVGLVAGVLILGLVNHRSLRRAPSRPAPRLRFIPTVAAEAAIAFAVLVLAALLTAGQPAREPQFVDAGTPHAVAVLDTQVADLQESLAVKPNRPGAALSLIDVFDTRRPAPAPIRRVLVQVSTVDGQAGAAVAATPLAGGRWSVAVQLPVATTTTVRVTVQRAGFRDAVHDYHWVIGRPDEVTRRATVSTVPLRTPLEVTAGLLAVAALVLAGMFVRRRRVAAPATAAGTAVGATIPEPDAPDAALVGSRS